ncbi:MAG: hypothetical protein AAFX46_07930, partial [Cyanobacteria bacterium J06636_27]
SSSGRTTTAFALPSPSQTIFLLVLALDCSYSYKIRANYKSFTKKNQWFVTKLESKNNYLHVNKSKVLSNIMFQNQLLRVRIS